MDVCVFCLFVCMHAYICGFVCRYEAWEAVQQRGGQGAARRFCEENFLSSNTLGEIRELRGQYFAILRDLGFVTTGSRGEMMGGAAVNVAAGCVKTIKAALAAGLYPNVVRVVHPQAT